MTLSTQKKLAADLGPSPFVLVRSKTGRTFKRCGIEFDANVPTPVDLRTLVKKDKALSKSAAYADVIAVRSSPHLSVEPVSEDEFNAAISRYEARLAEAQEAVEEDFEAVLKERDELRGKVANLRAEIALLTGRSNREGGPRENDDKPKSTGSMAMGG